jgi:hypothetical protein
LPATTVYWSSPALRIGTSGGEAVVGVVNPIVADVWNNSQADVENIRVQVYVCNYATGISPSSALPSATTALTGSVAKIMAGKTQTVTISGWKPTTNDLNFNSFFVNGEKRGHVCMAGNVFAFGPDTNPLPEGGAIPPGEFQTPSNNGFLTDPHHAQRNIAVLPATMEMIKFAVDMHAGNPAEREPQRVGVAVQKVRLPNGLDWATTAQLVDGGLAIVTPNPDRPRPGTLLEALREQLTEKELERLTEKSTIYEIGNVVFEMRGPGGFRRFHAYIVQHLILGHAEKPFPVRASRFQLRRLALEGRELEHDRSEQAGWADLKPGARTPITIQTVFAADERPGAFHVLDLTTKDGQGQVIGGARLMALRTE